MLSPYGLSPDDESRYLAWCFVNKRPYFGALFLAGLGNNIRQAALADCVADFAAARGGKLRALELGSWIGASSCTIGLELAHADAGSSLMCVDPWAPYEPSADMTSEPIYRFMNAVHHSNGAFELFKHNVAACGLDEIVTPVVGASQDVLPGHADASFDLIYIDANHRYSSVVVDARHAARLVVPGGVVCGDDLVLEAFETDRAQTIRYCEHDYVTDRRTGRGHHPGVALAVEEVFGRAAIRDGFWAVRRAPDGDGFAPYVAPVRKTWPDDLRHLRRDPDWPG